jgi:hypothetical protein
MAFESGTDYPESDADDEYERSVHASSPVLATDDEASPSEDDEGLSSNDHTPTTYGKISSGDQLPDTIITEWTPDECADFVGSLGLGQYADIFLGADRSSKVTCQRLTLRTENEIVGEALIALQHDDLKEMGITSVGHRLTILKSVYDIKVKQDIPIESDHYVPLCELYGSPWIALDTNGTYHSRRCRSAVCHRNVEGYPTACRTVTHTG